MSMDSKTRAGRARQTDPADADLGVTSLAPADALHLTFDKGRLVGIDFGYGG